MSGYRNGLRERKADIENASYIQPGLSTTRRPDALSLDYLTAFALGPVAIADSSAGPVDRPWYVRVAGNDVYVAKASDDRENWEAETLLFSFTGVPINEVDISFDQNARIAICAERYTGVDGLPEVWLYYFSTVLERFTFESFGSGRTPRILLDDPSNESSADVMVFYVLDGTGIVYRQQRDRYLVQHNTPVTVWENIYLEEVLYLKWARIAVVWSAHSTSTGRYSLGRLESTLYPYPLPPDDAAKLNLFDVVGGELRLSVFEIDNADDMISAFGFAILPEASLTSIELRFDIPIEDVIDTNVFSLISGSLNSTVFSVLLHTEDATSNFGFSILSGSMFAMVVAHTQYSEDAIKPQLFSLIGGTLAPL